MACGVGAGPLAGHGHHHGHHHWDPKPVGSPLERTKRFARLFMAPGVGHCGGGDGPNVFDTFAPLVQWVESGTPPERIVATKFVNNQASQGVALTRPLCAYPDVARWTGRGDPNSADNFVCTQRRHDGLLDAVMPF